MQQWPGFQVREHVDYVHHGTSSLLGSYLVPNWQSLLHDNRLELAGKTGTSLSLSLCMYIYIYTRRALRGKTPGVALAAGDSQVHSGQGQARHPLLQTYIYRSK